MDKLDKAVSYLSGAMEMVSDHGVEWRRKFIDLSVKAGLKIDYIDPTDKPGGIEVKIGENKQYQSDLKLNQKWAELREYVGAYRRYDLRFVDLSDFVIASVNPKVPQWGTANEVYEAERQHKPIFFLCDGGLANMPNWLFDLVDLPEDGKRCNVFASLESLIDELVGYNEGTFPLTKEWVLVRKHIELQRKL